MSEPISIAEACEELESKPQIEWSMRVDFSTQEPSGSLSTFSFAPAIRFHDQLFDVDTWRRLGAAVRNSSTLHELRAAKNHELLPPAAAQCMDAFWAELKHNKSIVDADLALTGAPMDHLGEFIQNNEALKALVLRSRERVSLEKSTVLSTAISRVQLTEVNINCCNFQNDGSLEQFLEGCVSVDRLRVLCKYNFQCTAVAAFLRDTTHMTKSLKLALESGVDHEQATKEIAESLVGNTQLKELRFQIRRLPELEWFEKFDRLLCDASSIQSISNSNHTLERISLHGAGNKRCKLSLFAVQCLVLNENEDKAIVIRDKIRRYYFVGKFDITPFSSMAVSVIPEMMSHIQGKSKGKSKLSAMYRLLRGIPELRNFLERKSDNE